jgi:hypothetical protein
MEFKCTYQNGKPYDWEKYTKNPFTRSFRHWMCLTSVQNDRVLTEEFKNLIDLEEFDDLSYLEGDSDMKKIGWLKKFKGTKYTVACVKIEDLDKFNNIGFDIVADDSMPGYLVMIRRNF